MITQYWMFSLQIRVLQPVRAKHPPPPPLTLVRKQPPQASSSSSTNSLDFSIKTLDQIRAEKRKKQQLRQRKADGDEAARREGEVAGGIEDEQTNRTTTTTTTTVLVPQGGDREDALKEERGREEGEEGDSGKELPKVVAPRKPRKRVVIKRSTLHKNADSALSSTAESAKSSDQETSDLYVAPSPKKKRMTEETSTSESQTQEPCFDATCIDRSAPLPNNHQEQRESKLTLDSRATFDDDCITLCLKNTAQRKKTNQRPSQPQSQP